MFKIALNAGHGLYTAGKRCLKSIDPNETREWTLNSRICNKIQEKLKDYTGYELIRLDDTTGKTDVALKTRTNKANTWGADFYLAIHHNAGIKGGSGGGLETYVYPGVKGVTKEWQKDLYNACIKYSNLKGNRANGMRESDLHEVRESHMPSVLIECGFMDSTVDTPIILTDKFADQIATACVEVLVNRGKLTKKANQPRGYLDSASINEISGWAYDGTDKELEVHIYGYLNDKKVFGIPGIKANIYREDLKKNGIGNGKHGFKYSYDLSKYGDGVYTIKAYAIGGTNPELTNTKRVSCIENAKRKILEEKKAEEERKRLEEEAKKKQEEQAKKEQDVQDTISKIDADNLDENQKKNLISLLIDFIKNAIKVIFKKQ